MHGRTVGARARNCDVMTIEREAVRLEKILAQCIEVRRRDFNGGVTLFARQVSVHGTAQVIDRGRLTEMGVHHHVEIFKLLEDSIHGRRADVRASVLDGDRHFVHRQVAVRRNEYFRHRPLGCRDSLGRSADRRENLIYIAFTSFHAQRIGPRWRTIGLKAWMNGRRSRMTLDAPDGLDDFAVFASLQPDERPATMRSASNTMDRTMSPAGARA
jgi:hypothetical protein